MVVLTNRQYTVTCDICGDSEVIPDGDSENAYGVRDAVRWCGWSFGKGMKVCCDICKITQEVLNEGE